jgi:hypothetical protein
LSLGGKNNCRSTDQEKSTIFDQMAGAIWSLWQGGVVPCVSFEIVFLKLFPSLRFLPLVSFARFSFD